MLEIDMIEQTQRIMNQFKTVHNEGTTQVIFKNENVIMIRISSTSVVNNCVNWQIHTWQRMKAWNREDMWSTEALDCSANPAKMTCNDQQMILINDN